MIVLKLINNSHSIGLHVEMMEQMYLYLSSYLLKSLPRHKDFYNPIYTQKDLKFTFRTTDDIKRAYFDSKLTIFCSLRMIDICRFTFTSLSC